MQFGAPRVGNDAFAAEYAALIPDHVGVINGQVRGGVDTEAVID